VILHSGFYNFLCKNSITEYTPEYTFHPIDFSLRLRKDSFLYPGWKLTIEIRQHTDISSDKGELFYE